MYDQTITNEIRTAIRLRAKSDFNGNPRSIVLINTIDELGKVNLIDAIIERFDYNLELKSSHPDAIFIGEYLITPIEYNRLKKQHKELIIKKFV